MKELLKKIVSGKSLTSEEAHELIKKIMDGEISPSLTAGILVALSMKGETVEEIVGAVRGMREKAVKVHVETPILMDTCGTGGDNKGTFNFSTVCGFILSAGGVPVAKHGNRAVSSKAGSADVVEALGIPLEVNPEKLKRGIEGVKFGFLFAPLFHTAMKNVAPIRKELGIRTIFNLLGPLSNPASPKFQLIGIFSENFLEIYAEAMLELGIEGIVVHGSGYDEFTVTGENHYILVRNGKLTHFKVRPEELGLKRWKEEEIKGGNAQENADKIKNLFKGKEKGAIYEMTILNAGFAFYACGKADTPENGLSMAEEIIKSKRGEEKLYEIIEFYSR